MRTNFDLENEAYKYRLPLIGVFNKDQIPRVLRNGFYIINLQDDFDSEGNDLMGSHWTVFYIEGKEAVYFDSFGMAPPIEVQNFLKPFLPYPYNTQIIQSMRSTVCGDYVMFFMRYMYMNQKQVKNVERRFKNFLGLWDIDVSKNRDKLINYLSKIK